MTKSEKVIKALECCEDIHRAGRWASGCIACPYAETEEKIERCDLQLLKDAAALLKEQEEHLHELQQIVNDGFDAMKVATGRIKELETLLKEQEEKQIPKPIIHGSKEEYWGEEEICPDCGKQWESYDVTTTHFCPGCGRAVKWE